MSPYRAAVFGATSAIAQDLLRTLVADHKQADLLLIARDAVKLEAVAADLRTRGATCHIIATDLTDPATEWKKLLESSSPWNLFLLAHGSLPEQDETLADGSAVAREIAVNFTSHAVIAAACSEILTRQAKGTLAVIGSVAGDRGRQSNFLYGSAKAGIDTFMAGLRHRHAATKDIHIVLLKPGMTDTPMTAGIKKGPLFTSSAKVGALGWQAIRKGKPVAYLPGWWRWVMCIICSVPTPVFHRTRL
ncbi:SDR family NAD(P)-dependent oxidoreductase [Luteolibacter flavescens]|uniref:SDR family NAD(P)-dependent oxidoreductase n=1 Tax=Luteolibacter flavescens TaxID=1859460 RepID=A0ABT3FLK5_9BACT|nr:SDR family NAD(P)-dependent oxidoreductase [Luteolibacter flavescens]MCW1884450.1 SDR family NAD(P)-dependent oxidoreductase [Luteolibacter flavescens]